SSSDDWEITFESITDLQWLGSGAQRAVFLGKLCNEKVSSQEGRRCLRDRHSELKETESPKHYSLQ
ncbi:mitogen-activated protein kinase kinase kinase 12, partial [Biomphalaria glabrata]